MGFRKTVTFILILIALSGYYYLFEVTSKEEKGREKTQKVPELKRIFTFKEDDVNDIRISRGEERIHYQKNRKGWQMVEPEVIQGDASALNGLLESIKTLSEADSVVEYSSNISEFGLDKPSLTIEVKTKGGALPRILLIGNDHPTSTSIYAKTSDSPRVFLVGSLIRWEVNKEFDNLKSKRGPFFGTVQ